MIIIAGITLIAACGLNIQYGLAGINSFGFIIFQAAGAYSAAIVSLGPSSRYGGAQAYVGGAQLPFPLPLIVAGAVGGALAFFVGAVTLRKLRGDYEGIVMLILSLIATGVAQAVIGLVNGTTGLAFVPAPLQSALHLSPLGYQTAYMGWVLVVLAIVVLVLLRLSRAPFGRALRAVRDNESGAASAGLQVSALRLQAFVIGGAVAGISGALLVEYVGAWAPSSWTYPETFALLAAIIIGGTGNWGGVSVGTILVPVLFFELTRFLPQIGYPGLIDSLEWVVIGALILGFLWLRPRGLLPERPQRLVPQQAGPMDSGSVSLPGPVVTARKPADE
ncbi:MAG: branched-chain amino acid ABC transporter permease [Solirubrobacteraceae bacterium]